MFSCFLVFHEIIHDFSDFHLPEKFPRHFFQGTPDQVAGDFEVGEGVNHMKTGR